MKRIILIIAVAISLASCSRNFQYVGQGIISSEASAADTAMISFIPVAHYTAVVESFSFAKVEAHIFLPLGTELTDSTELTVLTDRKGPFFANEEQGSYLYIAVPKIRSFSFVESNVFADQVIKAIQRSELTKK